MWGKTNIAERCATYGQNPLAGIEVMWGLAFRPHHPGAEASCQNPLAGIEVMWGLKTKATSLPISWSESPGGD